MYQKFESINGFISIFGLTDRIDGKKNVMGTEYSLYISEKGRKARQCESSFFCIHICYIY